MAVLATGQTSRKLGLSNNADKSKQIVFVKLTDSSLEALSQYINHVSNAKNHSTPPQQTKPSIQFSHNSGTFTVPILGEDGSTRQQKFNFSLSKIQDSGPQGSFECLQSRRPGSLESLGPVQDKVHVQASERDAYTRFGERMSDVKKENEKRTTRYLDRTSTGSGSSSSLVNNKIVSRKHILANKTFSGGRSNDLHRYSHTHGSQVSRNTSSNPSGLNGCHPMLDRNKHKRPTNPEIMKRTLKERVVHLLAVRPYKKPELLDRMTRDGLREKEKKELFPLVKQLSQMKDNTYHLQRHFWNDVSEDWPFYTEEERQTFRRRKPQNLTPPGSDGSTGSAASGHSSSSSHPASPQPSLKRPASATSVAAYHSGNEASASPDSQHLSKKKRVSNFIRAPGMSPIPGKSPNSLTLDSNVMSGESKTNAWLKTNQELASTGSSSRPNSTKFTPNDFLTKFSRIGNGDQRRIYKAEFNKDYNRYMVLYKQIDRVSRRFSDLKGQLSHTPEFSPDHDRLKALIVQEYQSTKSEEYTGMQEEFQYLHKKLDHIKKLVHDYDTKYLSSNKTPKQPLLS